MLVCLISSSLDQYNLPTGVSHSSQGLWPRSWLQIRIRSLSATWLLLTAPLGLLKCRGLLCDYPSEGFHLFPVPPQRVSPPVAPLDLSQPILMFQCCFLSCLSMWVPTVIQTCGLIIFNKEVNWISWISGVYILGLRGIQPWSETWSLFLLLSLINFGDMWADTAACVLHFIYIFFPFLIDGISSFLELHPTEEVSPSKHLL